MCVQCVQKQLQEVFFKKGILKNFASFTGKQLFWSLFLIKLQACNFFKKILQHRCFSLKLAKFYCYVKIVFLKILQSSQVFSLAQEFPVNFATFLKNLFFRKTPPGIMCRIPGTWHDSSTMNITVEEFCQHRKKKKSWPWMLSNRASHYWRIVPVTVEQSYQGL